MQLPAVKKVEKWLLVGTVAYGLFWIPREGALWTVLMMGGWVMAAGVVAIYNRLLAGRRVSLVGFTIAASAAGASVALGWIFLTFFFMAMKTGLHAHGPEFTLGEIAWLWSRLPLWTGGGGIAGFGLALLLLGSGENGRSPQNS